MLRNVLGRARLPGGTKTLQRQFTNDVEQKNKLRACPDASGVGYGAALCARHSRRDGSYDMRILLAKRLDLSL